MKSKKKTAIEKSELTVKSKTISSFKTINPKIEGVRLGEKLCNKKYDHLTNEFKNLIYSNGPYKFFITITFAVKISNDLLCEYTKDIINEFNKKIFGKGYYDKSKFVEGFAFIEKHPLGTAINDYHVHLLVKCNNKYNERTYYAQADIFDECADIVNKKKERYIFNIKGIEFKLVYDDTKADIKEYSAIHYCLSDIYKRNTDQIKIITSNGLI